MAQNSAHNIWCLIASSDPEACRRVLPLWRQQGYKAAVLQIGTPAELTADLTVRTPADAGQVANLNYLAERVIPKSANLAVLANDHAGPDGVFTAQELAEQFFERFPNGFGVMQPSAELSDRFTAPTPFVGRAWIDSAYGGYGALHGGYRRWFGAELCWAARALHAYWDRPDLAHHTVTGPGAMSAATRRDHVAEAEFLNDRIIFEQRVREGFAGCEPTGSRRLLDQQVLHEAQRMVREQIAQHARRAA